MRSAMKRKFVERVREGSYMAEVGVEVIEDEETWSPLLSADDARKIERVRQDLRRGDIASAAAKARVLEVTPVMA